MVNIGQPILIVQLIFIHFKKIGCDSNKINKNYERGIMHLKWDAVRVGDTESDM